MAWVIRRRGALHYSGRLPRPRSFDRWAETEGREVVTALASRRWFSLIGKRRAAKREIWRELRQLAESGALAGCIHTAVAEYGNGIGNFALERSSLPRASVDLRRLFVVPRAQYNAWAFDRRVNPMRSRLNALFGSDIGHFDVPDMMDVLPEAYELCEDNLITADDFRDFTFANAVRLWGTVNPAFFKGTVVEKPAADVLRTA